MADGRANECEFIEIQKHRSKQFSVSKIIVWTTIIAFWNDDIFFIYNDWQISWLRHIYAGIELLYFRLRMNAGYKWIKKKFQRINRDEKKKAQNISKRFRLAKVLPNIKVEGDYAAKTIQWFQIWSFFTEIIFLLSAWYFICCW